MRRNRAGFSLIEMLAALGLFLVGAVSVLALYAVAAGVHKRSQDRSNATLIATSALSQIRAESVSSLKVGGVAAASIAPGDTLILLQLPYGSLDDFPDPTGGEPQYALILDESGPTSGSQYEWISYTGKATSPSPALVGCVRGLADSGTNDDHPAGSLVVPANAHPPGHTGGGRPLEYLYATVLIPPPATPTGFFEADSKVVQIVVGWSEGGRHGVGTFRTAIVNSSSN